MGQHNFWLKAREEAVISQIADKEKITMSEAIRRYFTKNETNPATIQKDSNGDSSSYASSYSVPVAGASTATATTSVPIQSTQRVYTFSTEQEPKQLKRLKLKSEKSAGA